MFQNECWHVINKKDFVIYSRDIKTVNLNYDRKINLADADGNGSEKVCKRNVSDIYWKREEDDNFKKLVHDYESGKVQLPCHPKDISMYMFVCAFSQFWKYTGKLMIVLPTPQFQWVPSRGDPKNENQWYTSYCRSTLLLYKPGANPDNFLMKDLDGTSDEAFVCPHDALLHFVNHDLRCPLPIKDEFLKSLQGQRNDEVGSGMVEDLLPSPEDDDNDAPVQQDEWMTAIGEIQNQVQIDDPEPLPGEDDLLAITSIDDYEVRSLDTLFFDLDDKKIDEGNKFIDEQKNTYCLNICEEYMDLDNLNEAQRRVFDAVMEGLRLKEQRLIDLSGGAGSGELLLKSCNKMKFCC